MGPFWIPREVEGSETDGTYTVENIDRLQDLWDAWDATHGPRWRTRHGCRCHDDPEVVVDDEEEVPDPPLFDRIRRRERPTLGPRKQM